MQKQEPVYIHLPPPPIYVRLPPGVERLISLIQENYNSQVAIYQQQRDFTRETRQLSNSLERDVNDRHDQLRSIHARLDYLTGALQQAWQAAIVGRRAERTGPSGPLPPPRPPGTFPMPGLSFIPPPPSHQAVIPTMDFDAPPVIPTPLPVLQKHRTRSRRRR